MNDETLQHYAPCPECPESSATLATSGAVHRGFEAQWVDPSSVGEFVPVEPEWSAPDFEGARMTIAFTVYGRPVPQGSSRAFFVKKLGRAVITSDNQKLKPWRQQVSETALALNAEVLDGPIALCADFFFKRPRSAPKSRTSPTVKPDLDKLTRAILDGLTGILYGDDAQVVQMRARKHYADVERVEISVRTVEEI